MVKKNGMNLLTVWLLWAIGLSVGIAVGGLFLGSDAVAATTTSVAKPSMNAITLSNPILGFLGKGIHTLIGWILMVGSILGALTNMPQKFFR